MVYLLQTTVMYAVLAVTAILSIQNWIEMVNEMNALYIFWQPITLFAGWLGPTYM